jgi:hypothetical protein
MFGRFGACRLGWGLPARTQIVQFRPSAHKIAHLLIGFGIMQRLELPPLILPRPSSLARRSDTETVQNVEEVRPLSENG